MTETMKFTFTKQERTDIQRIIESYLNDNGCATQVWVTNYPDGYEVGIENWEIGQQQTQEIKGRLEASGYKFHQAIAFKDTEWFFRGTVILLEI